MKTRIASILALVAAAAGANAQAVQVGPGAANGLGDNGFSNGRSVLWDNGATDGSNGYSTLNSLGRYIYDDFTVSDPAGWRVNDFHLTHIWNSFPPGSGSNLVLAFHNDAGGAPGSLFAPASITSYSETASGNFWFGRAEANIDVTYTDIFLPAGNYWVSYSVVGPENGFSMVRAGVTGNELWWRADDLGVFSSGSTQFGVAADGAWRLTGDIVPAPGALALLGLGGLAAIRRRR